MMRRAVFLDRDGTLNPDPGYISRPEDFELFSETPQALRRLRDAGFLLVIVTNQSGIARGIIPSAALEKIHEKMRGELEKAGAAPDAIYVCPHHPDFPQPGHAVGTPCGCRKPEPGLVIRAIADWKIDATSSFVVGDRMTDVQMGLAAGVPPVLIAPTKPSDLPPHVPCLPNLPAAVSWILSQG